MSDPYIISVLSQKGGVGKSTLARLIGVEFSRMDEGSWLVKIADLDVAQGTSYQWMRRRVANGHTPEVRVEAMSLDKALTDARSFHVMVLDCAGYASTDTAKAALKSKLVIVPSGTATDDLEPSVMVLHELKKKGVSPRNMLVVLTRVGESEKEVEEARDYFLRAGYQVAATTLKDTTLYRRALDVGQALTEVKHKGLAERAQSLFQDIIAPLSQAEPEPATKKENAA